MKKICIALTSIALLIGCKEAKQPQAVNPLLSPYQGAYQGVPAFDKMSIPLLREALDKSMAIHLKEIDQITQQEAAPTFENTVLAYDIAGGDLDRIFTYYGIYSANMSSSEFRTFKKEYAPILSSHFSKIIQNQALFERIKSVYLASQEAPLEQQKQRTLDLIYKQFEMSGANLDAKKKKRYAAIQAELSKLHTSFGDNVLADEEQYLLITKRELGGLPDSYISSTAQAAKDLGHEGKYAILNTRSFMQPFLTFSTQRDLRKKVWENYTSRGGNNDLHDNNKIISKILKLRDERVKLMGYDNFAQWRLQNRMAEKPENALNLLRKVWPYATNKVKEEVAEMQAIASKTDKGVTIEPWDYRYYAEKVRKQKYNLDSEEVKQYLELNQLREAMFFVGGELFGFEFKPTTQKVPVFHPDVKVWEVYKKGTNNFVGLWYLDPYARKGKRSGAWATTYRPRVKALGNKAVLASNNSNFVKPAPGKSVLVSWDDATTFFHEFGHALHFLSGKVDYPTLNGGVRDYTEFQSQLLERWLSTDKVINGYLKHYKTKEPMPQSLVDRIKRAATFNQGFATTEYLASAIMDLEFHTTKNLDNFDAKAFEKETLTKWKMPKEIVMRHRSTQFGHVFSSEGYAAAYYGYMWADVLTSDASEAFQTAPNGYYDQAVAEKLVKYLFEPRNRIDPKEAYRLFRGRDAKVEAILRDRGFIK